MAKYKYKYKYDDGGRSQYFDTVVGDCVTRAIAIATGAGYKVIHDELTKLYGRSPDSGLDTRSNKFKSYMENKGFAKHSTVVCDVTSGTSELKFDVSKMEQGRYIVVADRIFAWSTYSHCASLIGGVLHDDRDSRKMFASLKMVWELGS